MPSSRAGLPPEILHRVSYQLGTPDPTGPRALRIALERWGTALPLERPDYPFTLLGLALAGRAILHTDDISQELAPGRLLVLRWKRSHVLEMRSPLQMRMLIGNGTALDRLVEQVIGPKPGVFRLGNCTAFEHLHEALMVQAAQGGDGLAASADAILVACVHAAGWAIKRPGGDLQHPRSYLRARMLLDQQPIRYRSISLLAQEIGIDRSYLSRMFARIAGESPSSYARRVLLTRSADQIANGRSLAQVAHQSGYCDAFAFSHAFTAFFGMPPSKWCGGHP